MEWVSDSGIWLVALGIFFFICWHLKDVLDRFSDNRLKREQEKTKRSEFDARAAADELETERLRHGLPPSGKHGQIGD